MRTFHAASHQMLKYLFSSIEHYGLEKTMAAIMLNTSVIMLNQDEPEKCRKEFVSTLNDAYDVTKRYFEKVPSPTVSGLFRMIDDEWKERRYVES